MFNHRSNKKELLDAEQIPKQDLFLNLRELDSINRLLGGHKVTLQGLKYLGLDKSITYQILDIGSGGGDTLKAIAKWGRANGYKFQLTGVDLKTDCIEYATTFCEEFPEIKFIQSDYRKLHELNLEFDIIVTSLFCHHLTDDEVKSLFSWATQNAKVAFVMNDLHRNPFAYYSIALLTALFSKSYLVKNDAKLSVLRGFKKIELMQYVNQLTNNHISLKWVWAFRWLLVIRK